MEKRRAAKPIQIVRHLSVFFFVFSLPMQKKKSISRKEGQVSLFPMSTTRSMPANHCVDRAVEGPS